MDYSLATNTWDEKEIAAIQRVIDSGFFTMGKEVEAFEQEFAEKMGTKYAVMVNSGSSANLVAIAALIFSEEYNLGKGDEVIVPAVSWATTYSPLQQYGLKVKFVDIDLDTLNLDINQLEAAITDKTKAIMTVNLLGNPNDFNRLLDICKQKNIILIEDNCESLGAKYEGRQAGTFGVIGTYSTFFSHHLVTMEGGLAVTDDVELYDLMRSIRAHGWTRNLSDNSTIYSRKDDEFYESFNFILPGYNLRPIEMEAAIGREQIKKMDMIVAERRENGKYFIERLANTKGVKLQKEIGESSFFGFPMLFDNEVIRNKFVNIFRENSIECRPIVAGNFVKNKVIEYFDYEIFGELKNADKIHSSGLFVGNHQYDCKAQIDFLYSLIKENI